MRILLVGCSGFVGRALVPQLLEAGHSLTLVSRAPQPLAAVQHPQLQRLQADPANAASWQQPALQQALAQAEAVVNLAGEPIAEKRWTPQHLQLLHSSRIDTTRALVAAMAALPEGQRPGVLINGSAIGYYGTSASQEFSESSPAGGDVLGRLCAAWEQEAQAAAAFCRVVILRIGIVLGGDGGALGKMLPVFRMGFGGPIGDGQQWMSWIARPDLCQLISTALADGAYSGVYNAVAPQPCSMAAFAAALGRCLGRPSLLPVPGPLLQLLLGDGAKVVLEGQKVLPKRLEQQGFAFRYGELSAALASATS
ncbi:MAG: TIGR01777 family protein [Cyanobacteria bacterium M_surface_7_m2_037]|nr:TIGR01777 family protein [Cyanobacteria bacterium M_surface_7_m2_037]MBM5819729.1 TIGR01777 family protein [Cyanobacteria bacterium K_DeepCast_150m_m2_101]